MRKFLSLCLAAAIIFSPATLGAAAANQRTESVYAKVLAQNTALRASQPDDDLAMFLWSVSDSGAFFPMVQSDDKGVRELSERLSKGKKTNYQKAAAFHDWIAENIYYDYDAYYDMSIVGEESAKSVLARKIGICEGMSNLLISLLRAAGIPARAVNGYALGLAGDDTAAWNNSHMTAESNHQWAEAYIADEGRWINIDPTWDSGNSYRGGKYSYHGMTDRKYFDIADKDFARDHLIQAYEYYTFEQGNEDGYYSAREIEYLRLKDIYSRVCRVFKTTETKIPLAALRDGGMKSYAYSGEKIVPEVRLSVLDENSDFWSMNLRHAYVLSRGTDFKSVSGDNVNVGKATVKIIGTGRFYGTKTESFIILPAKPKVIRTEVSGGADFSWQSTGKGTSGYQVKYYIGGAEHNITVTNGRTASVVSAGKITGVQVRGYVVVDGKTYYGSWS